MFAGAVALGAYFLASTAAATETVAVVGATAEAATLFGAAAETVPLLATEAFEAGEGATFFAGASEATPLLASGMNASALGAFDTAAGFEVFDVAEAEALQPMFHPMITAAGGAAAVFAGGEGVFGAAAVDEVAGIGGGLIETGVGEGGLMEAGSGEFAQGGEFIEAARPTRIVDDIRSAAGLAADQLGVIPSLSGLAKVAAVVATTVGAAVGIDKGIDRMFADDAIDEPDAKFGGVEVDPTDDGIKITDATDGDGRSLDPTQVQERFTSDGNYTAGGRRHRTVPLSEVIDSKVTDESPLPPMPDDTVHVDTDPGPLLHDGQEKLHVPDAAAPHPMAAMPALPHMDSGSGFYVGDETVEGIDTNLAWLFMLGGLAKRYIEGDADLAAQAAEGRTAFIAAQALYVSNAQPSRDDIVRYLTAREAYRKNVLELLRGTWAEQLGQELRGSDFASQQTYDRWQHPTQVSGNSGATQASESAAAIVATANAWLNGDGINEDDGDYHGAQAAAQADAHAQDVAAQPQNDILLKNVHEPVLAQGKAFTMTGEYDVEMIRHILDLLGRKGR